MSGDLFSWLDGNCHREHAPSKSPRYQPGQGTAGRSPSCRSSSLLNAVVHRGEQGQDKLESSLSDCSTEELSKPSVNIGESEGLARMRQLAPSERTTAQKSTKSAAFTPDRSSPPNSPTGRWDPFPSTDPVSGKENAFSRMLSSASVLAGRSPTHAENNTRTPAKRNRPSTSRGGAPSSTEATRFCLCPICGRKVLIELCSHHLDKECAGPGAGQSQPQPTSSKDTPETPLATPPRTPLSMIRALTVPSTGSSEPCETPPQQGTFDRASGEVTLGGRSHVSDDFAIVLGSSAPQRTSQGSGLTEDKAASTRRVASPNALAATGMLPSRGKSAVAASQSKTATTPFAFRKKRVANVAESPTGAKTLSLGSWAMTACPVCRQQVRVNRCSWHLDNECRGISVVEGGVSAAATAADDPPEPCGEDRVGRKDGPQLSARNNDRRAKVATVFAGAGDADTSRCKLREEVSKKSCAEAMTACPICGQQVRADRCSWHLDNKCPGPPTLREEAPATTHDTSSETNSKRKRSYGKEVLCLDASETGAKSPKDETKAGGGDDAVEGLTALAAELACPICLCLFEDPHGLPCSHRFCKSCILECFRSTKRQECPFCKVPAWKRDLKRDVQLQNIVAVYRRMAS